MPSIDKILTEQGARLLGAGDSLDLARSRQRLSRLIWRHYSDYYVIRRRISGRQPYVPCRASQYQLIEALNVGRLVHISRQQNAMILRPRNNEASRYLNSGWLEELCALLVTEAGADECRLGQIIQWQIDGIEGKNEIDVLARKGDRLTFVSCKAGVPLFKPTDLSKSRFRSYLFETDYWDTHFAGGKGNAVLFISTDMIDEDSGQVLRFPSLMARASILDVDIVSLDERSWDRLVSRYRAILNR